MVTRHELLEQVHELVRPKTYLEVGVQHGYSIALALPGCHSIGIDPAPQVDQRWAAQQQSSVAIFRETSDEYFARPHQHSIDLAFIDGEHLVEYAWRDFANIEWYCHPKSVVVFDDILPYNSAIASRTMPPGGDWTGDVWKVAGLIRRYRPRLKIWVLDTFPTGTMIVAGFEGRLFVPEPGESAQAAHWTEDPSRAHLEHTMQEAEVPANVIARNMATPIEVALAELKKELGL